MKCRHIFLTEISVPRAQERAPNALRIVQARDISFKPNRSPARGFIEWDVFQTVRVDIWCPTVGTKTEVEVDIFATNDRGATLPNVDDVPWSQKISKKIERAFYSEFRTRGRRL